MPKRDDRAFVIRPAEKPPDAGEAVCQEIKPLARKIAPARDAAIDQESGRG